MKKVFVLFCLLALCLTLVLAGNKACKTDKDCKDKKTCCKTKDGERCKKTCASADSESASAAKKKKGKDESASPPRPMPAAKRPLEFGFEGFFFENVDNCCWLDSLLFSFFGCSNELDRLVLGEEPFAPVDEREFHGEGTVLRLKSLLPKLRDVLTSAREYRTDNQEQFNEFLHAVTAPQDAGHPGNPLAEARQMGEVPQAGPAFLRALGVPDLTTAVKLCVRHAGVEYCRDKPDAEVLARITALPCGSDEDLKNYIIAGTPCPAPDSFEQRFDFDTTFETGSPLRVSAVDRALFSSADGVLLSVAAADVPIQTPFPSRQETRIRRDTPIPEVLTVGVNRNVEGLFTRAEIETALNTRLQRDRLKEIIPGSHPLLRRDAADTVLRRLDTVKLARTYTREVPMPDTIDLGRFVSAAVPEDAAAPVLRYRLRSVVRYVLRNPVGGPKPSQFQLCQMTYTDRTTHAHVKDLRGHYIASSLMCGRREARWTTYDDLKQTRKDGLLVQNGNILSMGEEGVYMVFVRDNAPVPPPGPIVDV